MWSYWRPKSGWVLQPPSLCSSPQPARDTARAPAQHPQRQSLLPELLQAGPFPQGQSLKNRLLQILPAHLLQGALLFARGGPRFCQEPVQCRHPRTAQPPSGTSCPSAGVLWDCGSVSAAPWLTHGHSPAWSSSLPSVAALPWAPASPGTRWWVLSSVPGTE